MGVSVKKTANGAHQWRIIEMRGGEKRGNNNGS
jgi:hypothetical protein